MKIKDVIFENRKKIRLTQEQLADQLNVSSKTVSNWERGVSYPDILLIAKICNVLNISINEFFQVEDVKEIEGKIEYDYKAIDKFKTSMIISIALIFLPLLAFLGTLINSTGVFYFFIVLGAIGYFYSITSAIIASIKFYRYIQNNYYSYKYLNTHKNYNFVYLLFFYILLSILLSSDIFYYVYHYYGVDAGTILYLGISVLVYLIFLIIPILIFRKLNLKYSIKEKLPYLIFGLAIFATTIVFFMIDRYIFNIPLLLIPGQIVNYFGFKNLKEKK